MRLFIDYVFRAFELSFFVAFSGTNNVPGAFQLPDRLPDGVNALHTDEGESFERIIPILRQGEHKG